LSLLLHSEIQASDHEGFHDCNSRNMSKNCILEPEDTREKKNSHHFHYKYRLLLPRSEEMCWWTLYDTGKAIQDSTKSILLHRSCFQNLKILPVDVYWLFSCTLWVFEQSRIIPFEEQIHGEMNLQILISREGKVCKSPGNRSMLNGIGKRH